MSNASRNIDNIVIDHIMTAQKLNVEAMILKCVQSFAISCTSLEFKASIHLECCCLLMHPR